MNTQMITVREQKNFTSLLNTLVTGAFTFAIIAAVGVLTFAQFVAIA